MTIFKKIITSESVEPMNCKEVRLFIPLFVLGGQGMTLDEWIALDDHISYCPRCAKEYEETKFIVELVENHRTDLINKGLFSELAEEDIERELTFDENLEEIWDKVKRCKARTDHNRNAKQIIHSLKVSSAIAACFVIGIFIFFVSSIYLKSRITIQPAPRQATLAPKPSVKIELVSKNGNTLIAANQQIAVTNELETLVINGKHRLMMNTNTVLAVEPLVENSHLGCLVKLASGRIYTHVEHDGNPFIVDTAHGQAVITGTTFDVEVTDVSTTLIVIEGTVQFESQEGVANVTAGQTSEIIGQSAPSIPLSCNTAKLTTWATSYPRSPKSAQVEQKTDPWIFTLSLRCDPIFLDKTDYWQWIECERNWFKQAFPWIFQLKDALAKEGIEVDYPELLIETGDVLQFVCLEVSPAYFSVISPNSLLETVSGYGFDKQWLLDNVSSVQSSRVQPVLSDNSYISLNAFERWLEYLDETKGPQPPIPLYSYHAGKYLANTRSLIWFAVREGQYDLTDEERSEVLALLQEEITAAYRCQNDYIFPADEQKKPSCGEDIYQEPVDRIIGYIEIMKAIEEGIAAYEIGK